MDLQVEKERGETVDNRGRETGGRKGESKGRKKESITAQGRQCLAIEFKMLIQCGERNDSTARKDTGEEGRFTLRA